MSFEKMILKPLSKVKTRERKSIVFNKPTKQKQVKRKSQKRRKVPKRRKMLKFQQWKKL